MGSNFWTGCEYILRCHRENVRFLKYNLQEVGRVVAHALYRSSCPVATFAMTPTLTLLLARLRGLQTRQEAVSSR